MLRKRGNIFGGTDDCDVVLGSNFIFGENQKFCEDDKLDLV